MKAGLRSAFLCFVLLWLGTSDVTVVAASQCTTTGVLIQDNFDVRQGWFCDDNQSFSSWICDPGTASYLCQTNCDSCGGSASGQRWSCAYSASQGPGPNDPTAQNKGCSTNYAEYFSLNCDCYYPVCDDACQCASEGGFWDENMTPPGCSFSPIMINIRSNSVTDLLTDPTRGVSFDINADGAREQIAWTRAESPVGFLALDRNHNGRVDDGSELFGTATPVPGGARPINGFEALRTFDSDHNNSIDSNDPVYADLLLWFDMNHNGVSEPQELVSLKQAGVVSLSLQYRSVPRVDEFGNRYSYEAAAIIAQGNSAEKTRRVFDVYLATRR